MSTIIIAEVEIGKFTEIATLARSHNNANMLALPVRYITANEAKDIVTAFLDTPFEGGRHALRVNKIPC